ncbi:MAG: hypothetical protein IPJ65_43710 [Archangiaceae bacterium]|nr:hypothetical protein [Archangiaceae bacterium]
MSSKNDDDAAPRILGVRFGVNPNSSSLGVDVTYLLFGSGAVMVATLMLSAWLRGARGKLEPHGSAGDPSTGKAP